jgi:CHAT domain-containing protein
VREDSLAYLVRAFRVTLGAGDSDAPSRLGARGGVRLETDRGIGIRGAADGAWERAARRLAAVVLPDSLIRLLPDSGEVVIVPHGSLSLVPFAALPLGGVSFGERYAVRFAPSIAALSELEAAAEQRKNLGDDSGPARRARVSASALVVADPTMPTVRAADGTGVTLGQLGGALAEGTALAKRLGVTVLSQGKATEAEVRRRIGQASLVHFATHGYAYASEDRARDSFIALAPDSARRGGSHDGLLTAGELLSDDSLRLSAELIVLSACQTGLGDVKHAEGTIGLQRALLARGAGAVLVSLWSVDDDATRALMDRFYTHWLEDPKGVSKAEALRLAQREVRTDASHPQWSHPRFWGAFQLVGSR